MFNPFNIFRLKREERWPVAIVALWYTVLNALVVGRYADKFMHATEHTHRLFTSTFLVSGYDPLTYQVLTEWHPAYNIYRHPLLAFMMWPLAMVNRGLIWATGLNWAPVLMALLLVLAAVYSFVFLRRLMREVVGLAAVDATLLALMAMVLGHIMVSLAVPDHFGLSLMMLSLTLYVAGRKMLRQRPFTIWQTVLFFLLTAGTSLNNGLKVFLANLFAGGRRFFRPQNLLVAIILPSALLWGAARWEWRVYEYPSFHARQEARSRQVAREHAAILKAVRDTTHLTDSAAIQRQANRIIRQKAREKYREDHKKPWNQHTGKPMGKGEFTQWTDATTSRLDAVVHNWFGESLQLHRRHLLEDTLRSRPVVVAYVHWWSYAVEIMLVVLFLCGVWAGRRSRLLWLAMSWMMMDAALHLGLGFGINEVYIMTAHWAFTLPVAMAWLVGSASGRRLKALRTLIALLVAYLALWNGTLLASYLLS